MLKLNALTIIVFSLIVAASTLTQAGEKPLLIDTRSPAEYEAGHADGAVLVPYDAIEAGILKLTDDKNTPIYLYCGSGKRAEIARQSLERRGYTQVSNLGGLEDAKVFVSSGE